MKHASRLAHFLCLFSLMEMNATAQTPSADSPTTITQAVSSGGKSIQPLIEAKNKAAKKADDWNDVYVVTVAIAAVVAFAVFFTQRKAILESRIYRQRRMN